MSVLWDIKALGARKFLSIYKYISNILILFQASQIQQLSWLSATMSSSLPSSFPAWTSVSRANIRTATLQIQREAAAHFVSEISKGPYTWCSKFVSQKSFLLKNCPQLPRCKDENQSWLQVRGSEQDRLLSRNILLEKS